MEYNDLVHEYELTHSPGNVTDFDSLRELVIQNGFKLLVVRRQTWGKSYAIIDTVWFPSPSDLTHCKIWGSVFWYNGGNERICFDYPYKIGWYQLLAVSDIPLIVKYSRRS